ncbi:Cobalt/magnesium transport protein CorA [bacterium HR29]|jgi:magnesium transporter|nr:Cobalt/magnesium transport protein CorA [bacterium HR29]
MHAGRTAETGEVRTRCYRGRELSGEGFPLSEVSEALAEAETVVWVDLAGPSAAQLHEIAAELGLHELAVEDAVGRHQRPKLDRYPTHLFVSTRAVRLNATARELLETEVDAFVGPRWLVTVRKGAPFAIEPVLQRWASSPSLLEYGVPFLLYGVLDVVVETYFDAAEAFDEYYDTVSEHLFSRQRLDLEQQREWFEMRQALVRFHRLAFAMREAVGSLIRREGALIPDALAPYYQDVYDHILRASETADSLRDLVATLVETSLSLRDYRQNQIVKKVSSWAAILAVPALITGYYGMNVPYPGSGEVAGVVSATALMAGSSAALYALFRRLEWL